MLPSVDTHKLSYPSLPGGNSTTLTMCIHTIFLCGICQTPVGRHTQPCPPHFQQAPNHAERYCQPHIISPAAPYSCPNYSCIASNQLHWALRSQQEIAMHQGKAKLAYSPFRETKAMCGDNDEACHLALEPVPVTRLNNGRVRQALPAPDESVAGYPPFRPREAPLPPEWLSLQEWQKARAMQSRGKSILDIADAVHKNASKLRTYVDTYFGDVGGCGPPLPSANSTNSSRSTTNSSYYSTESSEDGLFPLDQETMVPQKGMPHPSFLSPQQQRVIWKMFQQNATVRSMADVINKNRQKLSRYINAYMRPKLLELQAKEREAEDAASPRFPPFTGDILHQTFTPQPFATVDVPGSTFQEPRLHSANAKDAELDAFLRLVDPAILTPPAAVPKPKDPKKSGEAAHLDTPKSASSEDSLFGDSPVDKNHVGPQLVSNHHEVETAQPATSTPKKRRFQDNAEMQAQPRRASKRLRLRSFP